MAMFTKDNGLTIKLTESVTTCTPMVSHTKVSGKRINNMAKELKCGLMALFTKVLMLMGRNRDSGCLCGKTNHNIVETFLTTKCKAKVPINFQTAASTKATGK